MEGLVLVEKGKTGRRGRRGVVTSGKLERGGEFREIGRRRRHGNGGKCRFTGRRGRAEEKGFTWRGIGRARKWGWAGGKVTEKMG